MPKAAKSIIAGSGAALVDFLNGWGFSDILLNCPRGLIKGKMEINI
jgi:hypothetical protein